MESKYEQLTKLKTLLDNGVLTPEEFDTAKKRILDSGNPQHQPQEDQTQEPQQEQENPPSPSIGNEDATPKKNLKWIIFGGIGAIVAYIVIYIASLSNGQEYTDNEYSNSEEDEMTLYEDSIVADYDYAEEIGDGLTIGNPWRLDYFKNEWGEEDKSRPMIYTTLEAKGWNIHIDYQLPDPTASNGTFRFYIEDNEGHKENSYGPVNIHIRGSDGETKVLEVTGTRDGITFVEDPANVAGLMEYLNRENFDILMEYDKYNERYSSQARWESTPGFFNEAIERLLKQ